MRQLLFLPLLLLLIGTLPVKAQQWQWAQRAGDAAEDRLLASVVDAQGNLYVAGSFNGTITFGVTTLVSVGDFDVYVAKITPGGQWLWAVRGGGTGYDDTGRRLSFDPTGNVCLTGRFDGTADFGATTISSAGNSDGFVAKVSPGGQWLLALPLGGTAVDFCSGVTADPAGNLYVTGGYQGTFTLGNFTLANQGGTDLFVAKLSGAGQWEWAQRGGGYESEFGADIAVAPSGKVVITGRFHLSTTLGTTTLTSSFDGGFVARLTPNGQWQWAVRAGSVAGGLVLDAAGDVYVTGLFYGPSAVFGSTTLPCVGGMDAFIAAVSATGQWRWAQRAGGADAGGRELGTNVTLDPAGNLYVTGCYNSANAQFGPTTLGAGGGAFMVHMSPTGQWLDAQQAGDSWAAGTALLPDGAGGLYLTGYFEGFTISFGNVTLLSAGSADIFVARLSQALAVPPELTPAPFTLSPNPATGKVRLSGAPAGPIYLTDALGRTVHTVFLPAGQSETKLDLTGLPPGLYSVRRADAAAGGGVEPASKALNKLSPGPAYARGQGRQKRFLL